ncbi:hypothetical protein [Streptomyces sp. NPDC054842]
MPTSERDEALPRVLAAVSMRDLLASCAAADAVSTPPPAPAPPRAEPTDLRHPEAA